MIKTPVKPYVCSTGHGVADNDWKYFTVGTLSREEADQIVSALNAQQPKCEACGGSGERWLDSSEGAKR